VIFVRHALPGERVQAVVTDRSHDRYWRADAVRIDVASRDRVRPPCPHAGPGACGGCDWQHATLPAQRRLKAQVVVEALRRLGGLAAYSRDEPGPEGPAGAPGGLPVTVEPLPGPGADGLGWRSRMRFAVTGDGTVGLREHRSHQVVATPDCRIAHPLVLDAAAGRVFAGASAVEVAASVPTGRVAVRPIGPGDGPAWRERPTGQPEPGARPEHDDQDALVEEVHHRTFLVDPDAFWQVHPAAATTLVDAVLAALDPRPGETALDLYSGAGLFAAFLAEAVGPAGEVVALEADRAAVRSAVRGLRDLPRVSVRPVRVTPATVRGAVTGLDLAVLDPPRTGAGPEVMAALLAHRPRAVAYVACDPAALARDLATAGSHGYRVTAVRAFDLFPMTAHVECVATLVPLG
jgi:tRNA/tmRNA/rRNA uracil-C5-methylase (TrmA/RlmC/RlmD family)